MLTHLWKQLGLRQRKPKIFDILSRGCENVESFDGCRSKRCNKSGRHLAADSPPSPPKFNIEAGKRRRRWDQGFRRGWHGFPNLMLKFGDEGVGTLLHLFDLQLSLFQGCLLTRWPSKIDLGRL